MGRGAFVRKSMPMFAGFSPAALRAFTSTFVAFGFSSLAVAETSVLAPPVAVVAKRAAKVVTDIVKFDCGPAYARIMQAQDQIPVQMMIADRLHGLEKADPAHWIKDELTPAVIRSMEQTLNFAEVATKRQLKDGETVFWLQQASLKALNERLWNMGGTEYYLRALDEELYKLLKSDPSLGRLVHDNYKDRAMISMLSPEDFSKKVLEPLFERVANRVAQKHSVNPRDTKFAWNMWIRNNSIWGSGKSLVDAHLSKLGINNAKDFADRIAVLKKDYGFLKQRLVQKNIPFTDLFAATRASGDTLETLARWFVSKGYSESDASRLAQSALDYKENLKVADFLPLDKTPKPSEVAWANDALKKLKAGVELTGKGDDLRLTHFTQGSWVTQQALLFVRSLDSGAIVAADIRGLGLKGLEARHNWLLAGADSTKIPEIYEGITKELGERVEDLRRNIQRIGSTHGNIGVVAQGDDLLFTLPEIYTAGRSAGDPGDFLTRENFEKIKAYLASQPDLYSSAFEIKKPGDSASIAEAFGAARKDVYDIKDAVKKAK